MSTRELVQKLVGYVQAGWTTREGQRIRIEEIAQQTATLGSHVEEVAELQEEPILHAAHA